MQICNSCLVKSKYFASLFMSSNIRFKIVERKVSGEVHVKENTQFNNIHANKVTVAENVTARLYGNVKNVIILNKGSRLILHGAFHGRLENKGGEIIIYK